MVNAWIKHLTAFRKSNPGMSLGDAMQGAKKTYKSMSQSAEKVMKKVTKKRRSSKKRRRTAKKSKKAKKAKRSKKGKRSRRRRRKRK